MQSTSIPFTAIQAITIPVWATMYLGVPKKRAVFSARRPKASSPNALTRARLEETPDEVVLEIAASHEGVHLVGGAVRILQRCPRAELHV